MESSLYRLEDDADELQEGGSACAFFCFPCLLRRRRHGGLEHRSLLRGETRGEAWWEERGRRAKEVMAKVGALLQKLGGRGGGGKKRRPQFQYDFVDYALNFDDGAGRDREEAAGRAAFLAVSAGLPTKDTYI